jgi:uncharacterized protein (DUF2141 family)
MTKVLFLSVFLSACGSAAPVTRSGTPPHQIPGAAGGTVEVAIHGIPSVEGQIYVELYDADTYFRYQDVLNELIVPVTAKEMVVRLENVPDGRYIVAVSHDPNANHALDTGWFGIPKEAYGFSRDARGWFGPPSFEDGAFSFGGGVQRVDVAIR